MEPDLQLEAISRAIQLAIGLGTACALLVCSVIAALFLSAFLGIGLQLLVGWLFIAAMALLIAALLIFLGEVFLATSRLRIGEMQAGFRRRPWERDLG